MGLGANRVGGNLRELKPQKRSGPRLLRRVAILFSVILLLLLAGHYGWGIYGERVLRTELQRYRAASEPILSEEFTAPPPIPPEENAAVDLVWASDRVMNGTSHSWAVWPPLESFDAFDDEQMLLAARLIRRSGDVWARLATAEQKPTARWGFDVPGALEGRLNVPWAVDDLERFLQLATRYYHQVGDDRRAVGCVRQVLLIGRSVRQSAEYGDSAGQADRTAARLLLQIAPHLRMSDDERGADVAELRSLIGAMLDDAPRRAALLRTLQWTRTDTLERIRGFADGHWDLFGRMPGIDVEARVRRWLLRPMALSDTRPLLRQADQVIAAARVADNLPTLRSLAPDLEQPHEERDWPALHLTSTAFGPRYDYRIRGYFQAMTERRMAAVTIAVRCYAASHGGALPATLDDLVPSLLPAVPSDPFASGRPLTYRPDAADPLLYSVGPDGKDDGGSEAPERDGREVVDTWDRLTETRDVVVHLKGVPISPQP